MEKPELEQHVRAMVSLARQLEGHLSEREAGFLAVLPFLPVAGEILEIGSFKGKSTVILAKSVQAAGASRMFACDPLSLPSETDPTDAVRLELPEIFRQNLLRHGVSDMVQMQQMKSSDLAASWNRPLKLLWIDGDHTYAGASQDVLLFQQHLVPGAIVCLHDVLHGHEGPIRVFTEHVVLGDSFGDCGMCGSIGWGQYVGGAGVSKMQWKAKLSLYRKLTRLIPLSIRAKQGLRTSPRRYKILRSRVPHGKIDPSRWLAQRSQWRDKTLERTR